MFKKKYPDYKTELPVVLLQKEDTFEELISAQEMNAFKDCDELMKAVLNKVNQ